VPTVVITGTASMPFMAVTAEALAKVLPSGEIRSLEGQEHNVDPTVLGPVLKEFFAA
jgi:hypothetical protein